MLSLSLAIFIIPSLAFPQVPLAVRDQGEALRQENRILNLINCLEPSLEHYRLIQDLRLVRPLDRDVNDVALRNAVSALGEKPVVKFSRTTNFLDFTHGDWKTRVPSMS